MLSSLLTGFGRLTGAISKASPEILLAAGVIGVVGSTVLACKATLKAEEIIDEHKENMDMVHEAAEKASSEKYTQHDIQLDTTKVYAHTIGSFVKAYAPAVILGALSIAAIISSHSIMKQRNLALTAALSSANAMFTEYRERVKQELGEETDERIFNGGKKVVKKIESIDPETGKKSTSKQEVIEYKDRPLDPYARLFCKEDSTLEGGLGLLSTYSDIPGDNYVFLTNQETWLNQRLHWRQHMSLLDVYESLGWKVSPKDSRFYEYRNMGWTDEDHIDLGLHSKRSKDFMNGETDDVWITFNCHPLPGMKTSGKYIAQVA